MSAFARFNTAGAKASEDRVGGGYEALPTGIYDLEIAMIFAGKANAPSKAESMTIVGKIDGKEFKETLWITNKMGEPSYQDKNDAKVRHVLPGYTIIDDICLFATGKPLNEQDSEQKIAKIYDYTEKKELNKPVEAIAGLSGVKVKIALLRSIVDKQKKNDAGEYVNTGETRTENEIDKVMNLETSRTTNEYRNEVLTPEFATAWLERNKGKDRNKATGVGNGSAGPGTQGQGRPGAGGNAFGGSAQGSAKSSIFG